VAASAAIQAMLAGCVANRPARFEKDIEAEPAVVLVAARRALDSAGYLGGVMDRRDGIVSGTRAEPPTAAGTLGAIGATGLYNTLGVALTLGEWLSGHGGAYQPAVFDPQSRQCLITIRVSAAGSGSRAQMDIVHHAYGSDPTPRAEEIWAAMARDVPIAGVEAAEPAAREGAAPAKDRKAVE
jgi:hypothetical protein